MRTFWTYFFIFLTLATVTQFFMYFSGGELYQLNIKHILLELSIIVIIALLISYILRKPKNEYNKKAN